MVQLRGFKSGILWRPFTEQLLKGFMNVKGSSLNHRSLYFLKVYTRLSFKTLHIF